VDDRLDRGECDGLGFMKTPIKTLQPDLVAQVRAIYSALENRPVQRACTRLAECCQFKLTGRTPYLTRGEAMLLARAVRATGRKKLPERNDGACPLLGAESGKCLVYADRPFGCRTHFCRAAGGPYPRSEVIDLIRELERIDAQLAGDGPHPLENAVSDLLRAE
jgi:Fe-S-cluster containining protein